MFDKNNNDNNIKNANDSFNKSLILNPKCSSASKSFNVPTKSAKLLTLNEIYTLLKQDHFNLNEFDIEPVFRFVQHKSQQIIKVSISQFFFGDLLLFS
jgi:hypothetical protein